MKKSLLTVNSSLAEQEINIYSCQKLKFKNLKLEIGCKSCYQDYLNIGTADQGSYCITEYFQIKIPYLLKISCFLNRCWKAVF